MAGNWLPTTGEEMFAWYNQQIRILSRHRHPHMGGEVPGAIDASGGADTFPLTSYVEDDEDYPMPVPPGSGAVPPAVIELGDTAELNESDNTPSLGTVTGVSRAKMMTLSDVALAGPITQMVAATWEIEPLFNTAGSNIGPDADDPSKLVVNEGGWFNFFVFMSANWTPLQNNVHLYVEWQDQDAAYRPTIQQKNVNGPVDFSLNVTTIWLPNHGWIKPYLVWDSAAAHTAASGCIDVTRLS